VGNNLCTDIAPPTIQNDAVKFDSLLKAAPLVAL